MSNGPIHALPFAARPSHGHLATCEYTGTRLSTLQNLQRAGRYPLIKTSAQVIWDLCGGIGSFPLGCAKAGLTIGSYKMVELNHRARGVFRANIAALCASYAINPLTLKAFDHALPSDVVAMAETVRDTLRTVRDEDLPTLIAMTAPCTAGSAAGRGEGPDAAAGRVFLSCLQIVGHVIDEYEARGLTCEDFAPVGWIFETSPLRDSDTRPGVRSLDFLYTASMGAAAVDNAGHKGSTAHRSTQMYSNLGAAADWPSMASRGSRMPFTPMHHILRPGEYLQIWDISKHGRPRWPDVAGQSPVLYPKFVRSFGSHAWRAQPLTRAQLLADSTKPDMFAGRHHAIGVSSFQGLPHVPSCEMAEKAMGFPTDYTAVSLLPDEQAFDGYRAHATTPGERYGYLGDVWDPNLIAAVLTDRMMSSEALLRPAQPAPSHPQAQAQAPETAQSPDEGARPGEPGAAGPSPGVAHRAPPPPPAAVDGQSESAPFEAPTEGPLHLSPADELEEDFATSVAPRVFPPHASDRQEPRLPTPAKLPSGSAEDEAANSKYRRLLSYLRDKRQGNVPPEARLPDQQFEAFVLENLVNPIEQFTPGNLHAHFRYWASFLAEFLPGLSKSKQGREVLRILESGVPEDWVPVDSPSQTRHPRWARNLEAVRRMLSKCYTEAETESLLSGSKPGRVHLPNLKSCFTSSTMDGVTVSHEAFVDAEVQSNVALQVVVEWWWPRGEPPECILPLGVAVRELTGKLRLTYDGRYINLFQRYIPFSYESLADMVNYLKKNGWLSVSDFKAGYHHVSLRPELARYVGFSWKGTVYVYAVLPFGLASACRIFSLITGTMFRPIRSHGIDLTVFIDDRCSHNPDREQAKLDTLIQFALMGALGWFINIAKSIIAPAQLAQFLGLMIDTLHTRFSIPEKKLSLMLKQIDDALSLTRSGSSPSSRTLASIAGRTMSTVLANPLAPLLCADLFDAIRTDDWDAPLADPDSIQARLAFLAQQLRSYNGAAFWQQPGGVIFAGDAGEAGAGGFTVTGELPHPIQISYTPEQQEAIRSHAYHSTAREIDMVHGAVVRLLEREDTRTALQHRRLKYLTDSQPAFHIIMGKRSPDRSIRDKVFSIWAMLRANNTSFSMGWVSRAEHPMPEADAHTRMVDNTAWSLAPWAFEQVLADLGVSPQDIRLDPFSQAEFDKSHTGRWFSLFDAPGSAGVDGFLQKWREPDGARPFCFVNGPFNLMARVIQKIVYEQVDCILIYPNWNKPWRSQLEQLPVAASTQVKHNRDATPFIPGSRVDAHHRALKPYWKTQAALVRWPRQAAQPRQEAVAHGE